MGSAGKKILCIEDDRETASLIEEELRETGYQVELADDAEPAGGALEDRD